LSSWPLLIAIPRTFRKSSWKTGILSRKPTACSLLRFSESGCRKAGALAWLRGTGNPQASERARSPARHRTLRRHRGRHNPDVAVHCRQRMTKRLPGALLAQVLS
jgi:hypothetical protein